MAMGQQTTLGLYRSILQNEGILGLWTGNTANLIRVFPSKAIIFSSNDLYTSILRSLAGTPIDKSISVQIDFITGGLAGMTATSKSCDFIESEEREEAAFTHSDKERYSGVTRDGTLSDKEDNFVEISYNSGSVSSRSLNTNKVEPLPSLTYSSESDPIHSLLDDTVLEENIKDNPRNQVMLLLDNQFTGNNLVPIGVDDLKLEYDGTHGQQLQGNTTELKKYFDEDDTIHSHLESDFFIHLKPQLIRI
jgi:hypothetical protein